MSAEDVAKRLIQDWEKCKLTAYPDPATGGAPWTCGWGAVGPDIQKGTIWSQSQADERLAWDLAKFATGVRKLVKDPATDNELGAMISLAYNVGLENFKNSTLLRKFNSGNHDGSEFAKWVYANGKKMNGLINRRRAERKVFES